MNAHGSNEDKHRVVFSWFTCYIAGYTNDLGLAVAYEYEPRRDVKTLVSNAWSTNVISTFAYTYDEVGRRTVRIDDGTTTNLFGYTPRSELVSAEMGTNTYSYDPIGNRTSTSENGTTTTYAANELNQYTTLNPGTTNSTPFAYDADGNMTTDGTWSYAWDAENRLIEVQPPLLRPTSPLVCDPASFEIVRPPCMLERHGWRKGVPIPTFQGEGRYRGGFSDHLPVAVRLNDVR